jgi:hypothetical protein
MIWGFFVVIQVFWPDSGILYSHPKGHGELYAVPLFFSVIDAMLLISCLNGVEIPKPKSSGHRRYQP